MRINVSVVSHAHFSLIKELDCLPLLAQETSLSLCVLDNIGENGFKDWCAEKNIHYLLNEQEQGFGENNNKVFNFFKKNNDIPANSKFLVLNPDAVIEPSALNELLDCTDRHKAKISTANLYRDKECTIFDNAVRTYTSFFNYFSSIFFGHNPSIIDKSEITKPVFVDWAAASLLLFDAAYFDKLNGFDEAYFMYCEDIDICMRSDYLYNEKVLFCPQVKAVHYARHASRSMFSRHLYWHLSSIYKYLNKKRKFDKAGKTTGRVL